MKVLIVCIFLNFVCAHAFEFAKIQIEGRVASFDKDSVKFFALDGKKYKTKKANLANNPDLAKTKYITVVIDRSRIKQEIQNIK